MKKNEPQKQEEQELHEVVLLKDHKHNGELCLASSSIKVNTADKNWLLAQRLIAPDNAPAVAE